MIKCDCFHRKIASQKGAAAIVAALAINGVILIGGVAALALTSIQLKQVANAGKAVYAEQANTNAILITKKVIDAKIWTRDGSTGIWSTAQANNSLWSANSATTPKGSIRIYGCDPLQNSGLSATGTPSALASCTKIESVSNFGEVVDSKLNLTVTTNYPPAPQPMPVTKVSRALMPISLSAPPPTIVSITDLSGNPVTASTVVATNIKINGTGFSTAGSGVTVTIGSLSCGSVSVASATALTCSAPAQAVGSYAVLTTNPDLQTSSATPATLTYANPSPTVASISPTSGVATGGTPVTIAGTGFRTGATVLIGTSACNGVALVGSSPATSLTCTTTAGTASATAVTVKVTNTDTKNGSKASAYTYTSATPTISSLSDSGGTVTGGQYQGANTFTINGSNFTSGVTVSYLDSGGTSHSWPAVTIVSASKLTVTAPAGPYATAGSGQLRVTVGGQTSNSKTYWYSGWSAVKSGTVCECYKGYHVSVSDAEHVGTAPLSGTGGCPAAQCSGTYGLAFNAHN